ncbi:MAG: CGCGG family rSAM-modified RiPP protein [Alicyclobacillus sp.]|nr:CGCGG family rSAM-modified RiPP protein [Alicyclobacillus sp.]
MKTRWSVNLETEEYVANPEWIVRDAVEAVLETAPGGFVNLAVAPDHGHPDEYLVPELTRRFGDRIRIRYVDQCGCGGHVYRVEVLVPSP